MGRLAPRDPLQTLLSYPFPARAHGDAARAAAADASGVPRDLPAADGDVSFGLRGGPTRIRNLKACAAWMAECGDAPDWMRAYDWDAYNHNTLTAAELERLEQAFGAFFAKRSRAELYAGALERRILLAPCNDAAAILAHEQLRSRLLFAEVDCLTLPDFFAQTEDRAIRIRRRAPRMGEHRRRSCGVGGADAGLGKTTRPAPAHPRCARRRECARARLRRRGTPSATRYFVEHGRRGDPSNRAVRRIFCALL